MTNFKELLALDEETLAAYLDRMPGRDETGFWSTCRDDLKSRVRSLDNDASGADIKECINNIKGDMHALRFYLELIDFPRGSANPDPDSDFDPSELLDELEAIIGNFNPNDIQSLKKQINTLNEKLMEFDNIFDKYAINRGLPKQEKDKKIKHVEDLQQTLTAEIEEVTKLQESGETSPNVEMVKDFLLKQKGSCESATSVLTLSMYNFKNLSELPDETLDAITATLSIDTWKNMVKECDMQFGMYEQSKGAADKNKLIGTIKALKIMIILNGETHLTTDLLQDLEELENNLLQGEPVSGRRVINGLGNWSFMERYLGLNSSKKNVDWERENLLGMEGDLKIVSNHVSKLLSQSGSNDARSIEKLERIRKVIDAQQARLEGAIVVAGGAAIVKEEVLLVSKTQGILNDLTAEEWDEEWKHVREIVEAKKAKGEPQSYKISKKDYPELKLRHSFIVADGIPYATASKQYLGKGGFGKVKVVQTESGNNFALKVESTKHDADYEKKRVEIKAEKEILRELGKLHGGFNREKIDRKSKDLVTKEYSIMTLELGADVFTRCLDDNRRLGAQYRASRYKIAGGCLEAIKRLHDKGIIHRDIKPENFMMNVSDGVIMIVPIDFGLSEKLKTGELVGIAKAGGTEGYVAPEGKDVFSSATDVYALGVMLNKNFGINIPEMYAKKPERRPKIEDVLEYLKIQDTRLAENLPALSSFSAWKKEQSKTALGSFAALATAITQVSQEAIVAVRLSATPETSSPTHALQFSSAGRPTVLPDGRRLMPDGRIAPPPPSIPGITADGRIAPPPPPSPTAKSSATPEGDKTAPPPPKSVIPQTTAPEQTGPMVHFHTDGYWQKTQKTQDKKPEHARPTIHIDESANKGKDKGSHNHHR